MMFALIAFAAMLPLFVGLLMIPIIVAKRTEEAEK